jgi:DNA-binding transcriptional LysR family regulator
MVYHPQLDYFCAIVEKKTITAAADFINVTQQALSGYLKRLEEYYGLSLFDRSSNMELTDFGKELYHEAKKIGLVYDKIDNMVSHYANKNQVRLGCPQPLMGSVFDFTSFQKAYQEFKIVLVEGPSNALYEKVENRSLDISFLFHKPEDSQGIFYEITSDSCYFIINRDLFKRYAGEKYTGLAEKWASGGVDIREIAYIPFLTKPPNGYIYKFLDDYCEKNQINMWRICESENQSLHIQMCKDGIGFFIGSRYETAPFLNDAGILIFRLKEPDIKYSVGLYTKKENLEIPYIKKFWEAVINL